MARKKISTFDREMRNPKFKKVFYEGYKNFLISELNISLNERDNKVEKKVN